MKSDRPGVKARKRASVSAAYLSLLASRGVDVMFGNAGTDFSPLIEAYAELEQQGAPVPRPIIAAHENLAVTMAHGYGMVSRRIPAVMVHVSVGTANLVCGAMNAARENVGILLTAGRTPLTEEGRLGARDGYIHWAQEMYDQAGMLREIVKWDYELRGADQLEVVVDRAVSIAASEPRGPVYLSLPREVLAEEGPAAISRSPRVAAAGAGAPDPVSVDRAVRLLAAAKRPLIVTCNAGRLPSGFAALAAFAERYAVPVIQHKPRYLSLPSSHPMNLGSDPGRLVPEADVIVALECDVPWMPVKTAPRDGTPIINAGIDPLHTGIPIRGYASDATLAGDTALILAGLTAALGDPPAAILAARRKWAEGHRRALHKEVAAVRKAAATSAPIHAAWASHCLSEAKDDDAILINEYTLQLDHAAFERPDCYFGSSAASGLGWGAGAALGAKLAAPERQVIAVLGDGAYLFANPVAVHHAASLHELPVLFVVMNNSMWGAVHHFTRAMYPDGAAARANRQVFTHLDKLPAFEEVARAAGGWGERVERPEDLPAAIARALEVMREEKRHALLNVICRA
ncbi:MAG: thiamine pyrophosphate-requiring protein [Hyphomicrobiaceae bacterium]|nr:thiamine pyrophosphate-requiring protein [Hyphomicrobiaceae bacterium]